MNADTVEVHLDKLERGLNALEKGMNIISANDDRTVLLIVLMIGVGSIFLCAIVFIWYAFNNKNKQIEKLIETNDNLTKANIAINKDLTEAINLIGVALQNRASKEDIQLLEHKIFVLITGKNAN